MNKILFEASITGITDFDETCRVQCAIHDALFKLGYEIDSTNFNINFND